MSQIFWPKTAPCGSARQLHGLREIILKIMKQQRFYSTPPLALPGGLTTWRLAVAVRHWGVGDTGHSKSWLAPLPNVAGCQIVARTSNLAVLLTVVNCFSEKWLSKFEATRWQILRLRAWLRRCKFGENRSCSDGLTEIIKNYETAAFLLNPTFSIAGWANHWNAECRCNLTCNL